MMARDEVWRQILLFAGLPHDAPPEHVLSAVRTAFVQAYGPAAVRRPVRPAAKLPNNPPSAERVFKPQGCAPQADSAVSA